MRKRIAPQDAWTAAGVKVCPTCQIERPFPAGYYNKRSNHGSQRPVYTAHCRTCVNARVKVYQSQNVVKVREWKQKYKTRTGNRATRDLSYRKFNASAAAYDLQFAVQHGKCAICLRAPAVGESRFAFDHDHVTGTARGVLCASCNVGLGVYYDRVDLLLAAIRYLEYWQEQARLQTGTHNE